jgi:hypothetical protein
MPRKKKETNPVDLPTGQVIEIQLPEPKMVPANQVMPGQVVKVPGGEFHKVVSVDPILDPSHPQLWANEVIAKVEDGSGTKLVILKGRVELVA